MSIIKEFFGTADDGRTVETYSLKNKNGMSAKISTFGAILVSLLVPDSKGSLADVVLGYDELEPYFDNGDGFGAVIGRNANRIANAAFSLNGRTYALEKNDGDNNLHSGRKGFQRGIWKAEAGQDDMGLHLSLTYHSPDMEQGFPGNLDVVVTYSLTDDNTLILDYQAVSDQDTVVNLTNHSYFNLSGHNSGTILNQKVWIDADRFTPTDSELTPTGELRDVTGTPMDFRTMKPIGRDIQADYEPLHIAGGYDHNWVLNSEGNQVSLAAKMEDDGSGRSLEVYTDMPGLQFYTANFLNGKCPCKEEAMYDKYDGACFETQFYPNAVNTPSFPSPVLKAGELYHYTTVFRFLAQSYEA